MKKQIVLFDMFYLIFVVLIYLISAFWYRSLNFSKFSSYVLYGGWIVSGLFYPLAYKIFYNIQTKFLTGLLKILLINVVNHLIVDSYSIIIAIRKQDNEVYPIALAILAFSFICIFSSYVLGFLVSKYLIPFRRG